MVLVQETTAFTELDMKMIRWHNVTLDTYLREKKELYRKLVAMCVIAIVICLTLIIANIMMQNVTGHTGAINQVDRYMMDLYYIINMLSIVPFIGCLIIISVWLYEWNKYGPEKSVYGTFRVIEKYNPVGKRGLFGVEYIPLKVVDASTGYQTTIFVDDYDFDDIQVGHIIEKKVTDELVINNFGEITRVVKENFKFN